MKKLFWLIGMTVMLVIVLACPSLVGAAAIFEVSNLVISPNQVGKGVPADISVIVKNGGDARGSHSLELKIDGKVEAAKKVELDAGASKAITFTVIKDTPGRYSISIGDLKDSLLVTAAAFHVTDLTITPKQSDRGEPTKISVNVTNVGDEPGSYTLWLKLKKEVTLEPKASQTVSFTIVESSPGNYPVDIADLKGEFSVVAVPPWWHNWWLIGIAAVVALIVLALVALIIMRLRSP